VTVINDDYVEAILELSEGADASRVAEWLSDQGLHSQPMRAGLLVTGDRAGFEAAFGASLADAVPPVRLEVPTELAAAVVSATIPPPRRIT
jgi:hypothetical protein